MKKNVVIPALLLAGAMSTPTSAATVNGRITYLDEKARQVMVDSSDLYSLAPSVDVTALAVGAMIRFDVSTQNGRQVVTAVKKLG